MITVLFVLIFVKKVRKGIARWSLTVHKIIYTNHRWTKVHQSWNRSDNKYLELTTHKIRGLYKAYNAHSRNSIPNTMITWSVCYRCVGVVFLRRRQHALSLQYLSIGNFWKESFGEYCKIVRKQTVKWTTQISNLR